ncbi:uncharacterized protein KGF55_004090 [Candida pseudojiufengensis]|uniref:uncharacterized protein n=1 Tax=Candida pseudojiufengensis TaxID=497109 RepID=UPI0022249E15|nr:uncharacterized protein KGF55_004090 [Candida pseudojiufengensis]KAI5961165.1 hypothetical protein KGF55_004090 [Candida pseudojiufengensis]
MTKIKYIITNDTTQQIKEIIDSSLPELKLTEFITIISNNSPDQLIEILNKDQQQIKLSSIQYKYIEYIYEILKIKSMEYQDTKILIIENFSKFLNNLSSNILINENQLNVLVFEIFKKFRNLDYDLKVNDESEEEGEGRNQEEVDDLEIEKNHIEVYIIDTKRRKFLEILSDEVR